jgi:hypothetical protein
MTAQLFKSQLTHSFFILQKSARSASGGHHGEESNSDDDFYVREITPIPAPNVQSKGARLQRIPISLKSKRDTSNPASGSSQRSVQV